MLKNFWRDKFSNFQICDAVAMAISFLILVQFDTALLLSLECHSTHIYKLSVNILRNLWVKMEVVLVSFEWGKSFTWVKKWHQYFIKLYKSFALFLKSPPINHTSILHQRSVMTDLCLVQGVYENVSFLQKVSFLQLHQGDIHISGCYQPVAGKMVFNVVEARSLPRVSLLGAISE